MSGRDLILEAALPPILILILLLLALLLWRRLGRRLVVLATLLFLAASLPGAGVILTWPLSGAAPKLDPDSTADGIAAVLVPTAGAYRDAAGNWWPTETTIQRAAAGLVQSQRLGLPLILAGGNPNDGDPPEAQVLAAVMSFPVPDVRIEPGPRDSQETGAAVALLLRDEAQRVLLVTSPTHVARMAASLRHHGVEAVLAAHTTLPALGRPESWLPQSDGIGLTRAALYEYVGILWYLVSGRITLGDLGY